MRCYVAGSLDVVCLYGSTQYCVGRKRLATDGVKFYGLRRKQRSDFMFLELKPDSLTRGSIP